MLVGDKHYRTIWLSDEGTVHCIDQRFLPYQFIIEELRNTDQAAAAIVEMHVRGAGLIGATAGFAMFLAAVEASGVPDFDAYLHDCADRLKNTRPTAVNLQWAVDRQLTAIAAQPNRVSKVACAKSTAIAIADEDAEHCRRIGLNGLSLIEDVFRKNGGKPVQILTHCNAGWLAFVDFGSATAPIYAAHDVGIPVHVWVDETRPRCQGSKLTAWELGQHGVPHTIITDNAGGHLMQKGLVDLVLVGTDRTTRTGDVANKIGTYLKALAARDNDVPFFVALPGSTFDWSLRDGLVDIPIEQRGEEEVKFVDGWLDGRLTSVSITPASSPASNYGFDVTPARLITALITERGISPASEDGILSLYPERKIVNFE